VTSFGRTRLAGAGLALLAALAGGCAEPERRDWNVVVVMVDTLRADHLGAYGYHRDTSPVFDAFAAENVLFADHRAQAPCTYPSVNSLLTSRSPQAFWGRPTGDLGLVEGMPSLASILGDRGYATIAISASPVVRATPTVHNTVGGFQGGFDLFLERCLWNSGVCVHADAVPHLALVRQPFLLYLHYMDVHDPYRPPEEHRRFATSYGGDKPFVRDGDPNPIARMIYADGPDLGLTDEDLRHLVDLYDDSILYFDRHLGLLLAELAEQELLDETLIVVVADHGESFLEHGAIKHCRNLHETEVRIPLAMRVPGLAGPVRIEGPTANLDVVPTILDLLGEDTSAYGFEGRSLRRAIERAEPVAGNVFARWGASASAADGRYKLIANLGDKGLPKLYDLAADPAEETDVLDRERRAFHRLSADLEDWLAAVEPNARSRRNLERAQEQIRQLRAVGYLQ
jgi:arylsulfatase